jgi:hypothetical protein
MARAWLDWADGDYVLNLHRFTLVPKVVEHLIGDHRVTGLFNISPEIEWGINAWIAAGDTDAKGRSITLHIRPTDGGHKLNIECFAWPGDDRDMGRQFRLRIMRPDGSSKLIAQLPLETLLSHKLDIQGHYTVYVHLVEDEKRDLRQYIGLTKQGWTARWRQHLNAANNGSRYLFHEALRRRSEGGCEFHFVKGVGLSYEAAMALEEGLVAAQNGGVPSLYPHGLNMIPGGFAGLAYLGKYGFKNIGPKQWEARSRLLREFAAHCDRENRPNPLMAARWRDDEYARSVIFGNPNNFTEAQVDEIRYMASLGHPVEMIAEQFRCDPRRIKFLIGGQTYSRV